MHAVLNSVSNVSMRKYAKHIGLYLRPYLLPVSDVVSITYTIIQWPLFWKMPRFYANTRLFNMTAIYAEHMFGPYILSNFCLKYVKQPFITNIAPLPPLHWAFRYSRGPS